jgi:hypothetical protein
VIVCMTRNLTIGGKAVGKLNLYLEGDGDPDHDHALIGVSIDRWSFGETNRPLEQVAIIEPLELEGVTTDPVPATVGDLSVGMEIPVYGQQIKGCYVEQNGNRYSHYAIPGWYRITAIEGQSVTLQRVTMDPFITHQDSVLAVLSPNLQMAAQGLNPKPTTQH